MRHGIRITQRQPPATFLRATSARTLRLRWPVKDKGVSRDSVTTEERVENCAEG